MRKNLLALLTLLVGMISIQYGASVAKNLFSLSGIAGATTLRLFFASLFLFILFRPPLQNLKTRQLSFLLFYGLSLGLMNLSFYYSLSSIPLGIAVALEFTGPLVLAVFSSQRRLDFLWVLLAGLGILLLLPQFSSTQLNPLGVFFALLAGFFWALYIIFGKKVSVLIPTSFAITYAMFIATLVILPFGLFFDFENLWQTQVIVPGLIVGIFGSSIPYSLELRAMKNLSQKSFSILMSLEPVVATLIGIIFLKEYLSKIQIIAIILICTASLATTLSPQKDNN